MRRFLGFVVAVRLLILLHTSTLIASQDREDFSSNFRRVVNDILGFQQFETHLSQLRSDFMAQAPNGELFTKMVAEDITREVRNVAQAARDVKNAIVDSLANNEKQEWLQCCKESVNFSVDPRFPGEITKELCYIGRKPATPAKATGVSDTTVNAMKRNLKLIPSLKWQYFGNEHGTLYVYPGFPACNIVYDPRFRHFIAIFVFFVLYLAFYVLKLYSVEIGELITAF